MVTWVKHVACMGEKRNLSSVLENLKESDHLEDLCTDKRIILQWVLTLRRLMSYIYIWSTHS